MLELIIYLLAQKCINVIATRSVAPHDYLTSATMFTYIIYARISEQAKGHSLLPNCRGPIRPIADALLMAETDFGLG